MSKPGRVSRLRTAWARSLRIRLVALSLAPLLLAFPLILVVLVVLGGGSFDRLLAANALSKVDAVRNYLEYIREQSGEHLKQLTNSERLPKLLAEHVAAKGQSNVLNEVLLARAQAAQFDFLVIADNEGKVIASSTGGAPGSQLPATYVIRQAREGTSESHFERLSATELVAISPALAKQARIDLIPTPSVGASMETRGLLINAAARFPQSDKHPDAVLFGGILFNRNFALIDHAREIVYPPSSEHASLEGTTSLFLDDVRVTTNVTLSNGDRAIGIRSNPEVTTEVLTRGELWIKRTRVVDTMQIAGYQPLVDGEGLRIGMIYAGFPEAPYTREKWLLLGSIAGILALTMLGLTLVSLNGTRHVTRRLERIINAMNVVRNGDRSIRIGHRDSPDEIGQVAEHFDGLVDTLAAEEKAQRQSQQLILAEASRRRALFERVSDGIIVLNVDGSVFETNPTFAKMLGYTSEETAQLRVWDWDDKYSRSDVEALVRSVGPEGVRFRTIHKRKNGSRYDAEISASRVEWGSHAYVMCIVNDITERKHAEEIIKKRITLLTRPLDDREIAFDELFQIEEIQRIQDEFSNATGVASLITLPDGTPYTQPSNFTYLCSEIIRKSELGCANCIKSDSAIGRYNTDGPNIQPCLSGGLWDAGVSVVVGGHHVANWLIGQVRDEAQTEDDMRAYARSIGADEASFITAFQAVPIMSRERFEAVAKALFTLANQLANTAFQNIQQARFISERKQAEEEINRLAYFDQLTGLPNRMLLQDRLKQAMASSLRSGRYGALLLIDLDHFKTLNDTLGHDMGDLLLKQVAERLTDCVRSEDTVARLGGDEFVVMLASLSENQSEAASLVELIGKKISAALNQPYDLNEVSYRITPSLGASMFLGQRTAIDTLLKQADLAMYKAKDAGRNTQRFFDPAMARDVLKRASLERDLREAVQKKQFVLHYQAQVTGNQVTGAEVLLRWQHPERGVVFPGEFISVIEETGLIFLVGQWVLEDACKQLANWATRPEMSHLTVAVNISARQVNHEDFVDQVVTALDRSGANPRRLKLELTESLLVNNVEDIIGKMTALKEKGVGFSLDDFGTGYSSLAYLKRLPLDQLKIDQSFVRDILTDPNDAAIASMIVVLADSLGLGVIAEGVETEAQRVSLAQQGCHAFQGYFFSRPLPLDEFESFVERSNRRE